MWRRIGEIVRKEFYQTLRDPRRRMLLIVPPLIQLIIFGYAVNLDVENSPTAWIDMDRTPESRELRAAFQASGYFHVFDGPAEDRAVRDLLDRGEAQAVIRILPGFARDIKRGDTVAVQILVDGTNSNTASIISNYALQLVAGYADTALAAAQPGGSLRHSRSGNRAQAPLVVAVPAAEPRVWFNPDLRSRVYFVPGVVVNIIALVTVMLTAMSIVREKEIGTMEQLMVTPIRSIELILGKLLPFAAIGIFEVTIVVLAALAIFRVPLRGSALVLFGCAAVFLLSTLGVGLFLSTISQTQQQAMMASFFFFLPAMLLSGFAFPIRNMPIPVQYLTFLNPLRYFMQIVRGIFLKGVGVESLWREIMALAVFGSGILALSALRFRKSLD